MSETKDTTKKPKIVHGSATLSLGGIGLSATASVGVSFSWSHIQSAAFFSRQAGQIEKSYGGSASDDQFFDHVAYVSGAILTAVGFLEATINELYDAVYQLSSRVTDHLDPKTVAIMAAMWKEELASRIELRSLEKYQLALEWAKKGTFPTDKAPYQDVAFLIELRNALTHYKMLWVGPTKNKDSENKARKLTRKLEERFSKTPNPLVKPGSHFLHLYLGHACAKWAVESSLAFADAFFAKMNLLPAPYDSIRHRLKTE